MPTYVRIAKTRAGRYVVRASRLRTFDSGADLSPTSPLGLLRHVEHDTPEEAWRNVCRVRLDKQSLTPVGELATAAAKAHGDQPIDRATVLVEADRETGRRLYVVVPLEAIHGGTYETENQPVDLRGRF